jgi:Tol biopolymer transport system component/DNA-binding winged helix-turn-helix (wHTH) protein
MSGKIRFGVYELDRDAVELRKHGVPIRLQDQPFRVLALLAERPGEVITREELQEQIWGKTFVDFDQSLNKAVNRVREALNDNAGSPQYIETVPRRGYRFIAPVVVFPQAQANGPAEPVSLGYRDVRPVELSENPYGGPAPLDSSVAGNGSEPAYLSTQTAGGAVSSLRRRWLFAAGVLSAGLASLIWYLHRPQPPLRVTGYTQLTHDVRPQGLFGTDGVRLYLNVYSDPPPPAWAPVSGGDITRLSIPLPDPWLVDVSPDGSNLLVVSGDRGLWSVQGMGSSLRRVTDVKVDNAAWSPDGKSVVYSTPNGDIDVMRSDGSGAHRLANIPDDPDLLTFFFPRLAWSPDGSSIRFDRNDKIYEVKPDGSGLHPFLPDWRLTSAMCCGQWTFDGKFFVFLVFDRSLSSEGAMNPPSQIWSFEESRNTLHRVTEPVQLTSGPIRWGRPVPSRDGKKIFARGASVSGELLRLDPKSHRLQPYLGGISAEGLSFSPDGRFIAFVTYPEGILWRANSDGSNRVQLTDPPLYPTMPRWSPDGAQILFFAANARGHAKSYLVSSQGGAPRPILPDDNETQGNPDWSPDGRKIAFDSEEGTGRDTKFHVRILDLASHQITTLPGEEYSPRWSPDGRFLAAQTRGETRNLLIYDFQTQRLSVLQKGSDGYPTWSRDGRFITFLRDGEDSGVYRIRPSGGEAERVYDLEGFHFAGLFGHWVGLDPEDAPLLLRDTGSQNIYALTLEQK